MGPENCLLLQPYDAVYVEIPKVACTSLKVAIARLLRINLHGPDENPHLTKFPNIAHEFTTNGPLFPGLFSFTFVRNPWDRLVSCYRDKVIGEVGGFSYSTIRPGLADCFASFEVFTASMRFEEFALAVACIPDSDADTHFRSQHTFVTNAAGRVAIDFVGRYETLQSDLAHIQQRSGMPGFSLPRLQAARRRVRYPEYYNAKTRDVVAERYRTDIEMFDYTFA